MCQGPPWHATWLTLLCMPMTRLFTKMVAGHGHEVERPLPRPLDVRPDLALRIRDVGVVFIAGTRHAPRGLEQALECLLDVQGSQQTHDQALHDERGVEHPVLSEQLALREVAAQQLEQLVTRELADLERIRPQPACDLPSCGRND